MDVQFLQTRSKPLTADGQGVITVIVVPKSGVRANVVIRRSIAGNEEWTVVAQNVSRGTAWSDYNIRAGTVYEYIVEH